MAGNYAYVTDANNGLVILNVSNPASLTLKGTYATADNSYGVAAAGNYAYLADGKNGLVIIGIDTVNNIRVNPTEKAAGFSALMAISILLLVFMILRKKSK